MARKPSTKKTSSTAATSTHGLRERKKIEYNEHKLAVAASQVVIPAEKPRKKVVKKATAAKTKGAKGTTYQVLIKRALKNVEAPGWGIESIYNYLVANNGKDNRRFIRAALNSGVEKKLFVKTKGSYRLSKKTQDKMKKTAATKKKTTTKKTASGKKKAATKKKTATKKATTKKTTKKSTTKKAGTKKATTKKTTKKATTKKAPKKTTEKASRKTKSSDSESTPKKKSKKVIGPPTTDAQPAVTEASGVWQYYDNGWFNYAADASRIVEGVYQEFQAAGEGSGLDIRAIQSGHFSYMINFKNMEQTNTTTGTMRKIRRA